MKLQKLVFSLGWMLIVMLAGGCVKSSGLPGTPSREAPLTLPASKAFPSSTFIQIISGATPMFMPTPTPTLTPVPTQTPAPSETPTVIPTLSVEDARLRLLDLLAGNGHCRLPCLWGITPGESTTRKHGPGWHP